jgi:hypothetical protein
MLRVCGRVCARAYTSVRAGQDSNVSHACACVSCVCRCACLGLEFFFYPGSRAGRVKVSKVVEKNGSAHAWPDSNLSSTRMSGYAVGGQVFGVPEFRSWQKFPNTNPKRCPKTPDFYAQIQLNWIFSFKDAKVVSMPNRQT